MINTAPRIKRLLKCFTVLALILSAGLVYGDVNVLIVGSTSDGGDRFGGQSDAFVPTAIATELDSILSGAGLGTVNVVVEERYATASDDFGSSYSYNLTSWYHWPYPAGVEVTNRWPNLRGELGTAWDYVILIGDPYTMERLPGHYANGVEMIAQEVAKGSGETVLLMPWPADGNTQSSVAHYKEVVYRAGRTGGHKVAPAALAWQADGSQTGATHPSTRGAYICAASIYSRIWGQSASSSSYSYDDTLADLVNTTVTTNVNEPNQYTGYKMDFQNTWLMLGDKRREVWYSEKGSSTESYYANKLRAVLGDAGVMYNDSLRDSYSDNNPGWTGDHVPIAWNHGRSGDAVKGYVVNTSFWQLAFTFDFQLKSRDWPDEEGNDFALARIYSRELNQARSLTSQGPSMRNAAWRTIWGQFHKMHPAVEPVRDNSWHVATQTENAFGAFVYTLYSGRCPVNPAATGQHADAQMLGYQTAWRLGTCSSRAPGFKVMPSATTAVSVTPTTTETMTVQFLFAPRTNVTVHISSSDTSAGIVGAQTLVFTPSNYNTPQAVTVAGVPGSPASAPFNVVYSTTSDDPAYDGLSDSWAYSCERTLTSVTHTDNGTNTYSTPKNFGVTVNLNASGADSGNTVFAGPNHGALIWSGPDVVYTPDTDYIGPDGFAYYTLVGGTLTTGYIEIDVLDSYPAGSARAEVGDSTATEEGATTGSFTIIREGSTASSLNVNFAMSGTATVVDDYTLSASSPVSIPAGTNAITIILTPVDDSVSGEHIETATLTVTAGAGYTEISNPATVSISDNDNTAPTVDAGTNQTATLSPSTPWTPASTAATKAWYDASDAATITESGGAISLWSDKSGNTHHLAGTAGSEPQASIRTINGNAAVDFQGGDMMSVATRLGFGTNPDIMAFIVMERDGGESTIFNFGTGVDKLRTGTYGNTLGWYYEGGNEKYGAAPAGVSYVSCWQRPAGGNFASATYFHNGTELSRTGGGNDSKTPTDGSSYFSLGADHDASGTLNASVGEVVFIESNDTNLRHNAEGYLAHKWGLEGNLPAGHPYKDSSPGAPGVAVNLAGVVDDVDGDTLTTAWTLVSGPGGAQVMFGDASVTNTTATFWESGTYVLRLTTDDGYGAVYDDVTIIVNAPQLVTTNHSIPHAWLNTIDASWSSDYEAAVLADQDGDGFTTAEEYWSGTDPMNSNSFLCVENILHDGTNIVLRWQHATVDVGLPDLLIQTTTNLTGGLWNNVGTNTPVNGTNTWMHLSAPESYYRLVAPGAP